MYKGFCFYAKRFSFSRGFQFLEDSIFPEDSNFWKILFFQRIPISGRFSFSRGFQFLEDSIFPEDSNFCQRFSFLVEIGIENIFKLCR